jgi:hypothetical protein
MEQLFYLYSYLPLLMTSKAFNSMYGRKTNLATHQYCDYDKLCILTVIPRQVVQDIQAPLQYQAPVGEVRELITATLPVNHQQIPYA